MFRTPKYKTLMCLYKPKKKSSHNCSCTTLKIDIHSTLLKINKISHK